MCRPSESIFNIPLSQTLATAENRVLRRTYGSKREEIAGGWRRLYNEELHKLYASPDIIKVIRSRTVR
jgi:hypothetical protein